VLEFKTYYTGSTGNLHVCTDEHTRIAIDFGVPFPQAQKAFDYKISSIDGALITHAHRDHCKGVPRAAQSGVDCYAIKDVFDSLGISSHRAHIITPLDLFHVQSFRVLPFPVQHDVPNVGFLIQSDYGGKLLYITDSYYCKYRFTGVDIIAVECNYRKELLEKNIQAGLVPEVLRKRITRSHFEIENVKKFLHASDLSRVREIHLIHLSSTNSDPEQFKKEVQKSTGCPVYIK